MPNWCSTDIIIQSDDTKKIEELYNLIGKWDNDSIKKSDFSDSWLGNIVGSSKIAEYKDGYFYDNKGNTVRCRGSLTSVECVDNCIYIYTETAWCPMLKMWQMICDKYLSSDYTIWYHAVEPGCCVYDTNDPDYLSKYIIDAFPIGDEGFSDEEYQKLYDAYVADADEQTVISYLQDLLHVSENDLQKLLILLEKSKFADCVCINKWNYCDVSECD